MLQASSGNRSEMVENSIQCTKQSSIPEHYPAQNINCTKVGKMGVKIKRKHLQVPDLHVHRELSMNVFF